MAYQRKISVRCMDWVSWHHFTRDYTQNTSISPRFIASCWKSSHEPNIVWVNTCPSSSNTGPVEPTCTKESWTMDLQLTSQKMCFRSVNSRSEQFIITIITIVDQIICPIELHIFYTSQTINNNNYVPLLNYSPIPDKHRKVSRNSYNYMLPWCLVLWEASDEAPHVAKDFGL